MPVFITRPRCLFTLYIACCAVLSLYVMSVFIPCSSYGIDHSRRSGPVPPVAYRLLMPTLTHGARALVPGSVEQALTPLLIDGRDSDIVRRILRLSPYRPLPWPMDDDRLFDTFIQMLVVYASLLAFLAMLYTLTRALLPESRIYALATPVFALLLLPVFVGHAAYTYDFSELFFSCAGFFLLFRQRWRSYLFCLAFATFNKETAIFIIFFYFIWFYQKLSRQRYLMLGITQLLIYGVIETGIRYAIGSGVDNGPSIWEDMRRQLFYLYGYDYQDFLSLLFTLLLLTYCWQEKPAFLRAGLWMLLPNAIAYFVVCRRGEFRDLYWSMPVMMILATHTLVRMSILTWPEDKPL